MTALLTALQSGFTSKQIIDFLIKKFPRYADKINTAVAMGFTPNQIIKFLSGGRQELNSQENIEPLTEHQQTRQREQQRTSNINQTALGLAGTAATGLGAYALARALPTAVQQIAPQLLGKAPIPPSTPSNAPISPTQATQPTATPIAPSILPQPSINPLQSSPLKQKVDQLIQAKNTPESISAYLKQFNRKEVADLEKASGQPIDQAVQDYFRTIPKPQEPVKELKPEIIQEKDQETIEKPKKIESKGNLAALPSGEVGEITNVRNGIAEINIDGKTKSRKVEDLIESPLPEKDLADLYSDLVGGIEKETGEEVSRNVYWAGYNPKNNELAYVPHLGALYIYDNISPEDASQLTSILAKRKSTGENFLGRWTEGSKSPIGAEMFKLIQRLQKERGGKGSEYSGKFEKIYDALEPAAKAAKEKHKEKKKEQIKKVMDVMEEPKTETTKKEVKTEIIKEKPKKKEKEIKKSISESLPKPKKASYEWIDREGKKNIDNGEIYDNIFAITKYPSGGGYKIVHIPSSIILDRIDKKENAISFLKDVYDKKVFNKKILNAKTLDELANAINKDELEVLRQKYRKY